jgi:site-specific recombinase XerD
VTAAALVFGSPTGTPVDPHDDWDEWHALLSSAGVREARVHDPRHTAATLLLGQGIDIRIVQQILGHSQLSQTQRYTHVPAELLPAPGRGAAPGESVIASRKP